MIEHTPEAIPLHLLSHLSRMDSMKPTCDTASFRDALNRGKLAVRRTFAAEVAGRSDVMLYCQGRHGGRAAYRDVGPWLHFLLAIQVLDKVTVADGCSAVRERVRAIPLPEGKVGLAVCARSTAMFLEKPQRMQNKTKIGPRGTRIEVQLWTAVTTVRAASAAGAGGNVPANLPGSHAPVPDRVWQRPRTQMDRIVDTRDREQRLPCARSGDTTRRASSGTETSRPPWTDVEYFGDGSGRKPIREH